MHIQQFILIQVFLSEHNVRSYTNHCEKVLNFPVTLSQALFSKDGQKHTYPSLSSPHAFPQVRPCHPPTH